MCAECLKLALHKLLAAIFIPAGVRIKCDLNLDIEPDANMSETVSVIREALIAANWDMGTVHKTNTAGNKLFLHSLTGVDFSLVFEGELLE